MNSKWTPFLDLCPTFGHLGAHLEAPGGKKSVPKTPEGDFVDIVSTFLFVVFVGFWSFGPPGGGPKAVPERHLEPTGALWGHFGQTFWHFFLRLNFEVDFESPVLR